jgi:hypothetical protein
MTTRKPTGETQEKVIKFCEAQDIRCETAGGEVKIWNSAGQLYFYAPSTGLWSADNGKSVYYAKGIAQFVENYLNRFVKNRQKRSGNLI